LRANRVTPREISSLQNDLAGILAGEGQFDKAETLLKALSSLDAALLQSSGAGRTKAPEWFG
jgi:hypothetical protein